MSEVFFFLTFDVNHRPLQIINHFQSLTYFDVLALSIRCRQGRRYQKEQKRERERERECGIFLLITLL